MAVAIDSRDGNVLVADINSRIQELAADGTFITIFGSGTMGTGAGELIAPSGLAVDPRTGDVYVLEVSTGDMRVDRYTASGKFLWAAGEHVNATNGSDLCVAHKAEEPRARCAAGIPASSENAGPYAFKFAQYEGNLLAFGGPRHLLYVGNEYRVQEFDAAGNYRGEIVLTSLSGVPGASVVALALDEQGDLYVVYHAPGREAGRAREPADHIYGFNPKGALLVEIPVDSREAGATVSLTGLAVDARGRLAVIGGEVGAHGFTRFGALYDARTGARLSDYVTPSDNDGIALGVDDDLYIAATDDQEVTAYAPAPLFSLITSPVPCGLGAAHDRMVSLNCALEILQ